MLGYKTLEALEGVSPSGQEGFEGLARDLIAEVAGTSLRLCKAGYQGGIDALADDIPIALECKRYSAKRKLDLRELEGELAAAARNYPDLQLWILACTVEVLAQDHEALKITAERFGLAVLVLDASPAIPALPTVPLIAALCAVDPATTLSVFRKAGLEQSPAIEAELHSIRSSSHFQEWRDSFKNQVAGLPIWNLAVRRHNDRLLQIIETGDRNSLGTSYDRGTVVTRQVEAAIDDWFGQALQGTASAFAIVLGERYDGKTWCVLHWLQNKVPDLKLPVFYIPSMRGMPRSSLQDLWKEELSKVLASYSRHAETLIHRIQQRGQHTAPWALVVLDGLNEYLDYGQCLSRTSEALGMLDVERRHCLVLATARELTWPEIRSALPRSVQAREIPIGPFNDQEFQAALRLRGLPGDYESTLPESARPLIRRPRYLDLVARHKDRLGSYTAVTPEVLLWLDACDKLRSKRVGEAEWGPEEYQELLRGLAVKFSDALHPTRIDLGQILGSLTTNPASVLRDLQSEGVLKKEGLRYRVDGDRLALGMGLHLFDSLVTAYRTGKSLYECLDSLLAPLRETDEVVGRLRFAATVALLIDPQPPEPVIDALVDEWLRSRNLGRQDVQTLKAIRHLLLRPLLCLAPRTWSRSSGNELLQEVSRTLFVEGLSLDRPRVRAAVATWFKLVPEAGSRFLQSIAEREGKDARKEVAEIAKAASFSDLHLKISGDEGVLSLHRVGLHLVSRAPDLVGPADLLALMAAELAAHDSIGDGERFIFRRSLMAMGRSWFEAEVTKSSGLAQKSPRKKIVHWLINCASRKELEDLARRTAPAERVGIDSWPFAPLSRETYDRIHQTPFEVDEHPIRFAECVKELVKNPKLPVPSDHRLAAMRSALGGYFEKATLYNGMGLTPEQHLFEQVLPVIAAWLPDLGRQIFLRQVASLTAQPPSSRVLAYELVQHAPLLDQESRAILLRLFEDLGSGTGQEKFIADHFLLAVLPGLSATERVECLLSRQQDRDEWTRLYHLVAFLSPPDMGRALLSRLRGESEPTRAYRLRYLLAPIGGIALGEEDRLSLIQALKASDNERFSALSLAASADMHDLPVNSLLRIATDRDQQRRMHADYASHLLLKSAEFLTIPYDSWPSWLLPTWRAEAATKRSEFREVVLAEIEGALYETFMPQRLQDRSKDVGLPVCASIEAGDPVEGKNLITIAQEGPLAGWSWRSAETTTGGLSLRRPGSPERIESLIFGSEEAAQHLNVISSEVTEILASRRVEHRTCWSATPFPPSLIERLTSRDPERVDEWLACLNSKPARAQSFWPGLLHSIFLCLLRQGDPRARNVLDMIYPFHRHHVSHRINFTYKGVNSILYYLSEPSSNGEVASLCLEYLIKDARNDAELFQIALGGRLASQGRLCTIIQALVKDTDPELRARGVRLAGWIEGLNDEITSIQEKDSSLWVRDVSVCALKAVNEETWSRHWFSEALRQDAAEKRWGAGILFVACVDERYIAWAFETLEQSGVDDQRRGEGWLLLEKARRVSERKCRDLEDVFLKHRVRDLEAVGHPWHPTIEFEELAS